MAECIEEGTLRAYTDGALTPEQEASGAIHLAQCERCSRKLTELNALASEVSSLVIDNSYVPDPRAALAQLRVMMPTAKAHTAAGISPSSFVAFTGETSKRRASSRPMRVQPVAMGVGLGAAMVAVLLSLFVMSGQRQTAYNPASEFVPKGMVRHLTVSHTYTTTATTARSGWPDGTSTEEVWLTNGKDHLLRHSIWKGTFLNSGSETWVADDAVYVYNYSPASMTTVYKYPYDARHQELYVPNEISYLLTLPNAKIVGDDILDGRPVTAIEAIADKTPPTPQPESKEEVVLMVTYYKLWVDKETSQVLQREHKTTFIEGSNKGTVATQTFKVITNELKDASQVAPDFFKFKLPYNATVVEEESPFGATPTPAPGHKEASEFVPEGMVRHLVVSDTTTSDNPHATTEGTEPNTHKREIWYANGAEHLLMRTSITGEGRDSGYFVWVDDDAVYTYDGWSDSPKGKIVEKSPYHVEALGPYAPDPEIITKSLNLPNAQVVGYSTLNGRPVVEIESPDIGEKIYSADSGAALKVGRRLWIDTQENRLLQGQDIIPNTVGQSAGTVVTMTGKVVVDELIAISELPADFFKFKLPAGATLVEVESPLGSGGPSPVAKPTFSPALGKSVLLTQWKQELGGVEIRPVDPATGNSVPGYLPFVIGKGGQYSGQPSLSGDGTRLAVIESRGEVRLPWAGGVRMWGSADVLHLIDVRAWREVTATLSSEQAASLITFSVDGKRLVLNLEKYQYDPNRLTQELVVVDAGTGSILARQEIDIRPSRLEFSMDGARLIVYGQRLGADPGMDKPGPPCVLLLDAATLDTKWDYTLEGVISGSWCESNCSADHSQQVHVSWNPALTLSHDRSKLYIVHADEEKLTTLDFQDRSVHTTEIAERKSWLEEFLALTASSAQAKASINGATKSAVLSPDGIKLYILGMKMTATRDPEQEPLDRHVIEVASGRKVATFESDVTSFRFSPDGAYLYLLSSVKQEGEIKRGTEVVDAQSLKSVARVEGWGLWSAATLDRQKMVYSARSSQEKTEFALFDPKSFVVTGSWSIDGLAYWLTGR